MWNIILDFDGRFWCTDEPQKQIAPRPRWTTYRSTTAYRMSTL